jgi:glycosyltransferase involved in cell wall biosynthesis
MADNISIILPAKNEAEGLRSVLPELKKVQKQIGCEILVVNDGSSDDTSIICKEYKVNEIKHPYSKGNGAAIKTGATIARGEILVFMDADGQHDPSAVFELLDMLNQGYDMVVGARKNSDQSGFWRLQGNKLYNFLASKIVGHKIHDLTSGFRAVKAEKFREFLHLLPNGFSYPTTITMAFFRVGYSVGYREVDVGVRLGKSHIQLVKDGVKFLLIIFKVGTLYSPLKVFVPVSAVIFLLAILYYLNTYITMGRFTNMSALLLTTSVIIFMIGLVSEQVTTLMYQKKKDGNN